MHMSEYKCCGFVLFKTVKTICGMACRIQAIVFLFACLRVPQSFAEVNDIIDTADLEGSPFVSFKSAVAVQGLDANLQCDKYTYQATRITVCFLEEEKIQLWQLCSEQGAFTYQFEIKTKMLKTGESLLIRNPVGDLIVSVRKTASPTTARVWYKAASANDMKFNGAFTIIKRNSKNKAEKTETCLINKCEYEAMVFCQLNRRSCELRGKRSLLPPQEQRKLPLILELGRSICTDSTNRTLLNLINTDTVADKTQFHISFGSKSGSRATETTMQVDSANKTTLNYALVDKQLPSDLTYLDVAAVQGSVSIKQRCYVGEYKQLFTSCCLVNTVPVCNQEIAIQRHASGDFYVTLFSCQKIGAGTIVLEILNAPGNKDQDLREKFQVASNSNSDNLMFLVTFDIITKQLRKNRNLNISMTFYEHIDDVIESKSCQLTFAGHSPSMNSQRYLPT